MCPTCHLLLEEGLVCEACASIGADTSPQTEGAWLERSGLEAERAFLFDAARRALAFARVYRSEEGRGGGARERACLVEVANLRALLSRARERARAVPSTRPSLGGPGLRKTRELEVSAEPAATRRGRAG